MKNYEHRDIDEVRTAILGDVLITAAIQAFNDPWMTIVLDGETVGHYTQKSNLGDYTYNVAVYSSTDLAKKNSLWR